MCRHARRVALAFVLMATLLVAGLRPAVAQASYDDELILAVISKPYMLSDGLIVIQQKDRYYLPLVQMAELFDFVITDSDLSRGSVSGWFLNEQNTFSISAEREELIVKGEKRTLSPDNFITSKDSGEDELYVEIDTLNAIFPVKMKVDLASLVLEVEATEPLPFQLKLEREGRREMIAAQKRLAPTKKLDLPRIENNYKLFSLPAIDVDAQSKWSGTTRKLTHSATFSGVQDMLGMGADYGWTYDYLDGQVARPTNIHLRLKRQAFGDDTMPLGIKNVELGDVRIEQRDMVDNSSGGRGIALSTFGGVESGDAQSFDQIVVTGDSIPGWEVELYRNSELIDFGTVDTSGKYRFENVQLNAGNNQIRIVLYGPQGQVEERIENRLITSAMVKKGETKFRGGLVDSDRSLIVYGKEGGLRSQPRGMAGNVFVAHGLTKDVTLFGSVAKMPTRTDQKDRYFSVGSIFSAFGGQGQAELYRQVSEGEALDLRFNTSFKGVFLNLRTALLNNFNSPDAGFDDAAKVWRNEVKTSTNVTLPIIGNLGLQLNAKHDRNQVGQSTTDIGTRQTLGKNGLRVTHETTTALSNNEHQNSSGKISASTRIRRMQFRSTFDYNIFPQWQASSIQGQMRYTTPDKFSASLDLQHNFLTRVNSAGVQLGYDFGEFLGSVDTAWSQNNGYDVTFRASTSLGPFGNKGKYIVSSEKMTTASPVAAKIFKDNNGDGKFDEGDEPVPEAKLLVGRRGTRSESDEDGYVSALQGGAAGAVTVEVDKSSLSDPYFKPGIEGYETIIRPGSMPYMEFPIIETGAIEGTVTKESDGSPVTGMKLQLLNAKGDVVDTVETAYDGFYTFEYVAPGDYTVRADPSYKVHVPPLRIAVASDDLLTNGADLLLMEKAEEAELSGQAEKGSEVAHTHDALPDGSETEQPSPDQLPATKNGETKK